MSDSKNGSWMPQPAIACFALVFAGVLLAAASYLAGQVARVKGQLEAFDLARSLVVNGRWSGPITFNGSTPNGSIEQFLMSLESADRLARLDGIETMHEFRDQLREVRAQDGPARAARMLIVPAGFLQAHRIGDASVDGLLAQGCVVTSAAWLATAGWVSGQELHWMPPAEDRRMIAELRARSLAQNLPAPDSGEYDAPLCAAPLNMPQGVAAFENTVFISADHPALQMRTSGAIPQLWLTVAAGADAALTLQRVRNFLTQQAQPAHPQIQLQVTRFSDYGVESLGGAQLAQWHARLRWITALCGLALLSMLTFLRWGSVRRELALRQALGQPPVVAWRRTAQPYVAAISVGVVGGLLLASGPVLGFWHVPPGLVVQEALQVLLVAVVASALLGALLALALRTEPLRILRLGAR